MANTPAPILAQLVEDHHAAVYRYAYRLAGSATEAEDLAQQVFLQAHRNLHQLRDLGTAQGWLFAICRNAFLKSQARQQPVTASVLALDLDHIAAPWADETEIDLEQLRSALAELPWEFRTVLLMYYFEEKSYLEIAAALEIPKGTVMSRLSRAKGYLRTRLQTAMAASSQSATDASQTPRGNG